MEVARHLQRWQNLLTAHSLELAELINNLDEEAAADIRKVPRFTFVTQLGSRVEITSYASNLCIKGDHACDPKCCK